MRYKLLASTVLCIILTCIVIFVMLRSDSIVWNLSFDFNGSEEGWFISVKDDTPLIVGCISFDGDRDLLFMKLDKNGGILVKRILGGPKDEYGKSILKLSDGYLIVGSTSSYGKNGSSDAWLIKVDENGNEIWNRTYGGDGEDFGFSILKLNDGYLIVGSTSSYGKNGSSDAWLIKVDENGNEIWNRTYGGDGEDQFRAGKISTDGNIFLAGLTSSYGKNSSMDGWLMEVDQKGIEKWNRSYGDLYSDLFNDVVLDDGKIIAVGHSECNEKWHGFLVITDEDGKEIAKRKIEEDESTGLSSITKIGGFYYAVGYRGVFGGGRDDLLLVKFDKDGNIVWEKVFGGIYEDAGVWIDGEDENLYLVGYKDRNGDSKYDLWVIKLKV